MCDEAERKEGGTEWKDIQEAQQIQMWRVQQKGVALDKSQVLVKAAHE